eukprot:COSAG02_NODE_30088_length_557_cov_1.198690_1_plen_34_part_10
MPLSPACTEALQRDPRHPSHRPTRTDSHTLWGGV